jgi:YD repeat-containing protein
LQSVTQRSSGGANSITRSTRYDVLGNAVYEVNERGYTTAYTYDKLSRVIAVKNALNQTTTITHDANGNKVAEKDWLGNATKAVISGKWLVESKKGHLQAALIIKHGFSWKTINLKNIFLV